jgi:hypothetical protein
MQASEPTLYLETPVVGQASSLSGDGLKTGGSKMKNNIWAGKLPLPLQTAYANS